MKQPQREQVEGIVNRFWPKVDRGDEQGCWLWTGAKNSHGYGYMWVGNQKQSRAHRISYELAKGPIPDGLVIDHLCRTRACVNPDHLEAVTSEENTRRGEGFAAQNSRKTHCPSGHEYTEENTYVHPRTGGRECRTCKNEWFTRKRKQERDDIAAAEARIRELEEAVRETFCDDEPCSRCDHLRAVLEERKQ